MRTSQGKEVRQLRDKDFGLKITTKYVSLPHSCNCTQCSSWVRIFFLIKKSSIKVRRFFSYCLILPNIYFSAFTQLAMNNCHLFETDVISQRFITTRKAPMIVSEAKWPNAYSQTNKSIIPRQCRKCRGDRQDEIAGRGGVVCNIFLPIKTSIFYKTPQNSESPKLTLVKTQNILKQDSLMFKKQTTQKSHQLSDQVQQALPYSSLQKQ